MTETLPVPTIRSDRLILRAPRAADAGAIALYCSDPRLARMTAQIPHPYPPGAAEAYLERLAAGQLAEDAWIIDASPIQWSDVVGIIIFRPDRGQIGYWVGVPFWGTGFASEAVEALVDHLFDQGVPRITADVMAENEASLRVLEKAGFTKTGEKPLYSVARRATVPGLTLMRERG